MWNVEPHRRFYTFAVQECFLPFILPFPTINAIGTLSACELHVRNARLGQTTANLSNQLNNVTITGDPFSRPVSVLFSAIHSQKRFTWIMGLVLFCN
jgi:hypothetical protein